MRKRAGNRGWCHKSVVVSPVARCGRDCKLQLLGPALLMTPQDEMVDQIKREITILKHINHPNVVDLKEVGT